MPELDPCGPVAQAPEPPTPLQARTGAQRHALAGTLRSIAAIGAAAATNLETGGPPNEMVGLIQTLDRLQGQAGAEIECLGALMSSAGSA